MAPWSRLGWFGYLGIPHWASFVVEDIVRANGDATSCRWQIVENVFVAHNLSLIRSLRRWTTDRSRGLGESHVTRKEHRIFYLHLTPSPSSPPLSTMSFCFVAPVPLHNLRHGRSITRVHRREPVIPYRGRAKLRMSTTSQSPAAPPAPVRTALHTTASLSLLLLIQKLSADLLAALSISFPAPLFAMLALVTTISLLRLLRLSTFVDRATSLVFAPGVNLLTRWLAVFFVPNLVMLPLAPALPGGDLMKITAILFLGFFTTLLASAACCSFLRYTARVITNAEPAKVTSTPPTSTPPSDTLIFTLAITSLIALFAALAPGNLNPLANYATRLYALTATLLTFSIGQRLPAKIKMLLHPLITCTVGTIGMMALLGMVTGAGFTHTLSGYYIRNTGWGGGNVLAGLLGPAVITFAFTMDKQRKLALARCVEVVGTSFFATIASLFGTAGAARLLRMSPASRLIVIPRTITAPLAIAIADMLGANVALAASIVALTGLLGANIAATVLSSLGVRDAVVRGLSVGASAHGLGTAALSEEGAAFAFAALAMTLVGIFSTVLVAYPPFRAVLLRIALGSLSKGSVS